VKRTEIVVLDNAAALAREAAHRIAAAIRTAVAARGTCMLALAGGNTPRTVHRELTLVEDLRWSHVHVFWSDERCVPPSDPRSNFRMAKETLLDVVPVPPDHIHRIRGEDKPEAAAAAYDALLRMRLGRAPHFDLVLLGMGEDGHVASLFLGHAALEERVKLAVAVTGPGIDPSRVTLTYAALDAAETAMLVVSGAAKAAPVGEVLGRADSVLPAARLEPRGSLVWLLDRAATGLQ